MPTSLREYEVSWGLYLILFLKKKNFIVYFVHMECITSALSSGNYGSCSPINLEVRVSKPALGDSIPYKATQNQF